MWVRTYSPQLSAQSNSFQVGAPFYYSLPLLFEHHSLVPRTRIVFGDGTDFLIIKSHHLQGAEYLGEALQEMTLNNLSDDIGREGSGRKLGSH
jgi:hypothetical protein